MSPASGRTVVASDEETTVAATQHETTTGDCLFHAIVEDDQCPVCDETAFAEVVDRAERRVKLRSLDLVIG